MEELKNELGAIAQDTSNQPPKSLKHEAAVNDLKNFITSILTQKLDDMKTSVSTRIQAQDDLFKKDDPKKANPKGVKK